MKYSFGAGFIERLDGRPAPNADERAEQIAQKTLDTPHRIAASPGMQVLCHSCQHTLSVVGGDRCAPCGGIAAPVARAAAFVAAAAPPVPKASAERAELVKQIGYGVGASGAAMLNEAADAAPDPVKFLREVRQAQLLRVFDAAQAAATKADETALTDDDRAEFRRCGIDDEAQMLEIKASMLAARSK